MLVKVCGITNASDAMAAVEAGARALGFNFYPRSPRYIEPARAAAITSQLPADIVKVGVFVNESPERMASIALAAGLDVVQLHDDEPAEAAPPGLRVWKAFRVDAKFRLDALDDFPAEAFLLDTPTDLYGGSGRTFDWGRANGSSRRILIAGGLGEDNVRDAIAAARPWGVDACSRLESSPGIKDHGRMARFIAAALSV